MAFGSLASKSWLGGLRQRWQKNQLASDEFSFLFDERQAIGHRFISLKRLIDRLEELVVHDGDEFHVAGKEVLHKGDVPSFARLLQDCVVGVRKGPLHD